MDATPVSSPIKKILIRTSIALAIIISLFFLTIGIILKTVVTPQKITSLILNLAHNYVEAQINCDSIDITYFSTFPYLGVKLQNGSIIHYPVTHTDSSKIHLSSPQDTLITFRQTTISINPLVLLFNQKVEIRQLEMENADIYAYVDSTGKANWDILSPSEKKEEETSEIPELNINNIYFKDIQITYDDRQQNVLVMIDSLEILLNGNLYKKQANLDLDLKTSGITSYFQEQRYSYHLPLKINTQLKNDGSIGKLSIEKGNINIGTVELNSTGTLQRTETPQVVDINLDFSLNASSLAELMSMIPAHVSDIPSKFQGKGKVKSHGQITGKIGKNIYPIIQADFQLKKGALYVTSHPKQPVIEKIETDLKTILDFSGKQKSSIFLNNLFMQIDSSTLNLKGTFDHILKKPSIQAQAKADINFSQLSKKFDLAQDMQMGGQIKFDLSAKCLLDDILKFNLGKIDVNGDANIKKVVFKYPPESLSFYAPLAVMKFGSNTQDSIRNHVVESLFKGNIQLDSINVSKKEDFSLNLGKFSALFRTSEPQDTSKLAVVTATTRTENIRLNMGDSIRLRMFKANAAIRLAPQKDNPALPEINAHISLDTLHGLFYTLGGRVHQAKLNLKINKRQTDSTRRRTLPDSIRRTAANTQANISFRLESEQSRKFLRSWEVSGSFASKDASLRTPYFPLPLRMSESDLTFTSSNIISLNKANIQIGNSRLSLKGKIEGIRRALLFNGKVSAKLTLDADSLNINELVKAAIAGSEFTQKSYAEKDSITQFVLNESNNTIESLDTIQSGIFIIPRNLDVEFNSKIKHAIYSHLLLDNILGKITLKDQAVHLQRLMVGSNVGGAYMDMVYKASNNKGAHLGLDVKLKDANAKELITAFPFINTLTPMLRSFEGVLDCNMTAVTELDSFMNVRFPQTTASCYVQGKDMVLLDGETFSEISNTLMFKKKSRNLIDTLSVEMILEDEKLMIFPFQLSIDRYKVAVGGIQNLDKTFDYHVTVLKSPIPFKLGLNITGNPDKMKIRLAKAKYKDLFAVAREQQLNNTTINIREEMENKLRKSILDILKAPSTWPMAHPSISLSDSLKQTYFQLDTTTVMKEEEAIVEAISEN